MDDINSAISTLNRIKRNISEELQPKLFQLDNADKPTADDYAEEKLVVETGKTCMKVLQFEFDAMHTFFKDTKFIWSAKENKAIKDIVTKIKIILKEADLEFSVENVRTSFQLLIKDIKDVDEFTYKNFSPAMINSRFNTIVANLKNLKKHDYSEELKEKLSHGKDWLS